MTQTTTEKSTKISSSNTGKKHVKKSNDDALASVAAEDQDSDSSEYSEWEGIETTTTVTTTTVTTTTSILKKRELDTSKLTPKEIKAAKAHYVFPERADNVLKESLMRASLNAEHAAINGFPEPSIYRDDDDPLGLFDDNDDDDDEDYIDSKNTKRKAKAKPKNKKRKI